jgi:hypothetical protein
MPRYEALAFRGDLDPRVVVDGLSDGQYFIT